MQSGTIIRRNPGVLIPNEFIEAAIKAYPNGWGAAFVQDGDLTVAKGDDMDLELFQETCKEYMGTAMTWYLCNSASAIDIADVSPYTLLTNNDDEKTPLLVAFLEGKFSSYEQVNASHPAATIFVRDYLMPKLQDMYDMADGDMLKVMAAVNKPFFKKEITSIVVPDSSITLVSCTGETLSFSQSSSAAEHKWGWTSRSFDKPTPKEEPAKPRNAFSKGARSTVREAAPTGPTVPSPAPGVTEKVATDIAAAKKYTIAKWKPEEKMNRGSKKDAYKGRIGYLPVGWDDNVEVEVVHDHTGKLIPFREMQRLGFSVLNIKNKLQNPPAVNGQDKDVDTKFTEVIAPTPTSKGVTAEILPILSPEQRKKIQGILADAKVQKVIDENADIVNDPNKIKELEAQIPSFAKQIGRDGMNTCVMSFDMIAELDENAVKVLAFSWQNAALHALNKLKAKSTTATSVTTEETLPAKRNAFSGVRKAG